MNALGDGINADKICEGCSRHRTNIPLNYTPDVIIVLLKYADYIYYILKHI